ncbi:MAG: 50S ribosomal protein L7/L12 [Nitrospira sp.]
MTNEQAPSAELPAAAVEALRQGNKIEAIKLVRVEHDIGLKESKDSVEAYLRAQPALLQQLNVSQTQGREGVLRWLVVVALLLAVGAYLYFNK